MWCLLGRLFNGKTRSDSPALVPIPMHLPPKSVSLSHRAPVSCSPRCSRALRACIACAARADPEVIQIWPEGVPGLLQLTPGRRRSTRRMRQHLTVRTLTVFRASLADKANGYRVIICARRQLALASPGRQ